MTFAADVEDWVKQSKENLTTVVRQSIQDVVNAAQVPVAKGGRMRVKTGFLRASGASSLTGMPTGPVRGDPKGTYDSPEEYSTDAKVNVNLGKLKIGNTFYFGWTAEYALPREAYDGFLETALQNWQQYVSSNAEQLKRRQKR